jgi:hypothetical protein
MLSTPRPVPSFRLLHQCDIGGVDSHLHGALATSATPREGSSVWPYSVLPSTRSQANTSHLPITVSLSVRGSRHRTLVGTACYQAGCIYHSTLVSLVATLRLQRNWHARMGIGQRQLCALSEEPQHTRRWMLHQFLVTRRRSLHLRPF